MRSSKALFVVLLLTATTAFLVAQAPKGGDAKAKAAAPAAAKAAVAAKAKAAAGPPANLGQLMKGIFYINANVIFAAQGTNPADIPQAKDPSVSPDALASTYGKWEAVENAALAIADASSLLTVPGRKCANGRNVPIGNADWAGFVRGVREAGMASLKAAQSKNQDNILDAADAITTACANCHDKYREKETLAQRCM